MKALTIRQPWAFCILHGKDIENRSWRTQFRGRFLIHTSQSFDHDGLKLILQKKDYLGLHNVDIPSDPKDYVSGVIIGVATLTDCVVTSPSPWFGNQYGHVLPGVHALRVPVSCRGALNYWNVPECAMSLVRFQAERMGIEL